VCTILLCACVHGMKSEISLDAGWWAPYFIHSWQYQAVSKRALSLRFSGYSKESQVSLCCCNIWRKCMCCKFAMLLASSALLLLFYVTTMLQALYLSLIRSTVGHWPSGAYHEQTNLLENHLAVIWSPKSVVWRIFR